MAEVYAAIPLSPIRKVIAARMAEAKRTVPHFRVGIDVEVDAIRGVRERMQACSALQDVTLTDLFIKACATALMEVPAVNVQWAETEVHQFHDADISVVTALADGLSTPIVRGAQAKSVAHISREVRALAARAACNALKMDEVFGGSFSVSNLGMYGVDFFDAIVNPPQCAILALGRAKPQCLVSSDRQPRVATVLRATLSVDHRAIDGATAATFLAAFRRCVEQPESLWTDHVDA